MAAPVVNIDTERARRFLFDRVVEGAKEGVGPNIARFLEFAGAVDGETWIEIQALKVPSGKWEETRFAHARDTKIVTSLLEQAEKWQPSAPGIYVIANQINPAVTTRETSRDRWLTAKKGVATTDRDITHRNVLFIDIDAERGTGTSSTDEEKGKARATADLVLQRLMRDLPVRSLGLGDSGNGYGVYAALEELPNSPEVEKTIRGILATLDVLFSNPGAKIDRAVSDAKRLVPAFGTTKRKGAPGIPERPHRRTAFASPTVTVRLSHEHLVLLFESLYGELPELGRAEVDKAMGKKPQTPALTPATDDAFGRANAVDVLSVMQWLGLTNGDGEHRCPGCGETAGTAVLGNGFKCSHARCANKGVRAGFRTVVDLVAEVKNVEPKEAVNLLAERFGFEGLSVRRQAAARVVRVENEAPPWPDDEPQESADPEEKMAPIDRLRARGALVGYRELLHATATPPTSIWFDGVLEDSHIEISGPSGHGKSTLTALLIVARANPTDRPVRLLGVEVKPAPRDRFVVTIQEENGKYSWRKKLEAACQALNLPVEQTLNRVVFLVRNNVVVGDPTWEAVLALGASGHVGGVFVDSRARVLVGESNKEEEQARIAACCFKLIETCKAPLVIVSHTRKGRDGSMPEEIEDVSGHTQRAGGADVLIIVTAQKDASGAVESATAKLAKLRNSVSDKHPAPVNFRMQMDMDGRWQLECSTGELTRDPRPIQERLRELLADAGSEGLTKYRMREVLRVNLTTLERGLSMLFADRLVTRAKAIIGGKQIDVFMLRENYEGGY